MMKRGRNFFCGVLSMGVLGSVFGIDIPDEVWKFRDIAVSNSTEVCISAEKLKANYKILEAEETEHEATYKVADMPRKGIDATIVYVPDLHHVGNVYREVGERPSEEKEIAKWKAVVQEKIKNFPKPSPASVKCLDGKEGKQTTYEFHRGVLEFYSEYFEDITKQGVFIQFFGNNQLSNFVKLQNNGWVGMQYVFDEEGAILYTHDYGPAPTEPRPKVHETGTFEVNKGAPD